MSFEARDLRTPGADAFASLFGWRRGTGKRPHRHPPEPARRGALLDALLDGGQLPGGLTLVLGDPGAGKTLTAARLAGELSAQGFAVCYVDYDWLGASVDALLGAQVQGELVSLSGGPDPVGEARTALDGGAAVIIDSLRGAAASAKLTVQCLARELCDVSRAAEVPLIATCQSAVMPGALAESTLALLASAEGGEGGAVKLRVSVAAAGAESAVGAGARLSFEPSTLRISVTDAARS